jgi:glycosyltransferase involved in cell wall biosynthesis
LFQEQGLPQCVHVNIVWKAGLLALRLKKKYGLPYIITENWTGYYPEDPNYIVNNRLKFAIFKKVYRNAMFLLPVTQDLGNRCNQLFNTNIPCQVIENAVDTSLFYPQVEQQKTILHISTMGYQKNTIALLDVLPDILATYMEYDLKLIGPSNEAVEKKVNSLPQNIRSRIHFTGNIPYASVAQHVRAASLLVLFSRYENLPCVILESLCCGVPVVSTDVGGIREVINPQNGLLVSNENKAELHAALMNAMNRLNQFDKNSIAESAKENYSYESIGSKYSEAYHEILK